MNQTISSMGKTNSEPPRLLQIIEDESPAIDGMIQALHRPVSDFMQNNPAIHDALTGTWLGHPLHPAIIPLPIGAWATGVVLDIASMNGRNRRSSGMADLSYRVGLVGAGVALAAGLAEWTHQHGNARRVSFVHAASNVLAAGLITTSLIARGMGARRTGFALAVLALGAVGVGGWLGGELTYRYGAGVGRQASKRRSESEASSASIADAI